MNFYEKIIFSLTFILSLNFELIGGDYGIGSEEYPYEFFMFENFDLTRKVFSDEQKLVQQLKDIRSKLQKSRDEIQASLKSIPPRSNDIEDPVGGLAILKRSALSIKPLRLSLKQMNSTRKTYLRELTETTMEFPNLEDWSGTVRGLFMLYDTYEFNITEAARGNIVFQDAFKRQRVLPGVESLTTSDFADLGQFGFEKKLYNRAVEFLRESIRLEATEPEFYKMFGEKIKEMARNAAKLSNKVLQQKQLMVGKNFRVFPYMIDEKTLKKKKKQPKGDLRGIDINEEMGLEYFFRKVCQDGSVLKPTEIPVVKCGFYHHFDPYLRLAPFKVEVMSRDPFLVVFPDFFSEAEIEWLLEYSKPRLSRKRDHDVFNEGQAYEYKLGTKTKVIHKTVQCWIKDVQYNVTDDFDVAYKHVNFPNLVKLARKMELAGQLNIIDRFSSTMFQTTNYGLGGTCDRHVDPFGYLEGRDLGEEHQSLIDSGDMIATFMGWLDDTEAGGGTAFVWPYKELLVMPKRGSLAFWHDLDARGFRLQETHHGGCPVLKGSKWILNKWVYYFNQFKNYPCGLDTFKKFPAPSGFYR